MSNETGFSPEDEWVLVPYNSDLRIKVNWEKKELLGAEYKGTYHKTETFTDEIKKQIKDFMKVTPLPFHHFEIDW